MRKLLVLVAALLLVAACSDSDKDDDAAATPKNTITPETTVPSLRPDEIDRSASPYCATWAQIRSAGGPRTQGLDDAAAAARRKEYYGQLLPLVEKLLSEAPEEIQAAVENALANTRDAATTGSFDSFRTDEAKKHTAALAQYALDHCRK